jgi:hypothetical protein
MARTGGVFIVSVWLIAAPLSAQPAKPPDRETIDFIKGLRNSDGGYAPAPDRPGTPVRSSLRATTAAIRALKYLIGGEPPDSVATARFVEKCFDKATGGFGDYPGEGASVNATAVGAMTLVDMKMPTESYRDSIVRYLDANTKSVEDMRITAAAFEALQVRPSKADDWLKQIAATRNADGTFGMDRGIARATGGTAVMILRLGGTIENREAVLKAMRSGQRPDGGFGSTDRDGSDLESTYRVMRAFVMLKAQPADPAKLRSYVTRCRSAAGGYGTMPGQPPTAAGSYYAITVSHWLDQTEPR